MWSEEVVQKIVSKLMSISVDTSPAVRLRYDNPYYERDLIEMVVRSLPKIVLMKMIGGDAALNPLELFGWYVLDDHCKGITGMGLLDLFQQVEKGVSENVGK